MGGEESSIWKARKAGVTAGQEGVAGTEMAVVIAGKGRQRMNN